MKGVSPLIAAVLLIAFTVAIATLIMGWFSTLTRTTTSSVTNQTAQAVGCSNAVVTIRDVYIQSAFANVIVENTGGSSYGLTGVQVINSTGHNFSTGFTAVGSFNKSGIQTFTITSASFPTCPGTFSKAFVTTSCGGVGDTFEGTPKCG